MAASSRKSRWLTHKRAAILLGFFTSMLGTVGSFLLLDVLNKELKHFSSQKAAATHEIEQLQAASSEYFIASQQGDLVYALSLQASARQDIVGLLYKGNLLDRATPVRNIIGALAIAKVLDYRGTYGQYEALNDAARQQLSFDRFMAVKGFERDLIDQSAKRTADLFGEVATLNQRIEVAERRLSGRQRVALTLSALGTTLLLFANLMIERGQEVRPPPARSGTGESSAVAESRPAP